LFRFRFDNVAKTVGLLTDRVRESTRADQQREKLAALGKLSAGLAHELNNPASAVRRSSAGLRDALANLREANFSLCREELSEEVLEHLSDVEKEVATEMTGSPVMDALHRSDREERITGWLKRRGVTRPWELAPALVEAEADDGCLDKLSAQFPGKTLEFALRRMSATIEVDKTLRQIESSSFPSQKFPSPATFIVAWKLDRLVRWAAICWARSASCSSTSISAGAKHLLNGRAKLLDIIDDGPGVPEVKSPIFESRLCDQAAG